LAESASYNRGRIPSVSRRFESPVWDSTGAVADSGSSIPHRLGRFGHQIIPAPPKTPLIAGPAGDWPSDKFGDVTLGGAGMNEFLDWGVQLGDPKLFQSLSQPAQLALLLGAIALLPTLLVTMTCFTRVVIVLSFVRQGMASQQVPPNSVLIGLAIFLTLFIMRPVLDDIGTHALAPYRAGQISAAEALGKGAGYLRDFMLKHTRKQDISLFLYLSGEKTVESPSQTPYTVLIPAFVISELKTALIMGFCIYLPFLLVDLVVSNLLVSMGMVMMPPALISGPMKLLVFVLADGWHLTSLAIANSFR
jgi:flagellar biosynthetic protein FliP